MGRLPHKNNMSVNIETPVKKVYIGSCWASQIGGVPGTLSNSLSVCQKDKVNLTLSSLDILIDIPTKINYP
jgi:hypothetical protein